MRLSIKNHLIPFLLGIDGALILIVVVFLFGIKLPLVSNLWSFILSLILIAGFLEEGIKFLLVQRWVRTPNSALLLGLGYGITEQYIRYTAYYLGETNFSIFSSSSFWIGPIPVVLMQALTPLLMLFWIRKNKPLIGYLSAIIFHVLYDLLVIYFWFLSIFNFFFK